MDYCEVDQMGFVRQAGLGEIINPLLAGASTGLLYKSAGERKFRVVAVKALPLPLVLQLSLIHI